MGNTENIVGEGENAGYQHFLLFPLCFQKLPFPEVLKVGVAWWRINKLTNTHFIVLGFSRFYPFYQRISCFYDLKGKCVKTLEEKEKIGDYWCFLSLSLFAILCLLHKNIWQMFQFFSVMLSIGILSVISTPPVILIMPSPIIHLVFKQSCSFKNSWHETLRKYCGVKMQVN